MGEIYDSRTPGWQEYRVIALADFEAADARHITIRRDEVYQVIAADSQGLWLKTQVGEEVGWFPANYTRKIPTNSPPPLPPPKTYPTKPPAVSPRRRGRGQAAKPKKTRQPPQRAPPVSPKPIPPPKKSKKTPKRQKDDWPWDPPDPPSGEEAQPQYKKKGKVNKHKRVKSSKKNKKVNKHLPTGWQEYKTDAGETYYNNELTGESTWIKPTEPASTSTIPPPIQTNSFISPRPIAPKSSSPKLAGVMAAPQSLKFDASLQPIDGESDSGSAEEDYGDIGFAGDKSLFTLKNFHPRTRRNVQKMMDDQKSPVKHLDMVNNQTHANAILSLENDTKEVYVHTYVLRRRCPDLLTKHVAKQKQKKKKKKTLMVYHMKKDFKEAAVIAVLQFIYTGIYKFNSAVTLNTAYWIYWIAREHRLMLLEEKAHLHVYKSINGKNVYSFMRMCHVRKEETMLEYCLDYAKANNATFISNKEGVNKLGLELFQEVMLKLSTGAGAKKQEPPAVTSTDSIVTDFKTVYEDISSSKDLAILVGGEAVGLHAGIFASKSFKMADLVNSAANVRGLDTVSKFKVDGYWGELDVASFRDQLLPFMYYGRLMGANHAAKLLRFGVEYEYNDLRKFCTRELRACLDAGDIKGIKNLVGLLVEAFNDDPNSKLTKQTEQALGAHPADSKVLEGLAKKFPKCVPLQNIVATKKKK